MFMSLSLLLISAMSTGSIVSSENFQYGLFNLCNADISLLDLDRHNFLEANQCHSLQFQSNYKREMLDRILTFEEEIGYIDANFASEIRENTVTNPNSMFYDFPYGDFEYTLPPTIVTNPPSSGDIGFLRTASISLLGQTSNELLIDFSSAYDSYAKLSNVNFVYPTTPTILDFRTLNISSGHFSPSEMNFYSAEDQGMDFHDYVLGLVPNKNNIVDIDWSLLPAGINDGLLYDSTGDWFLGINLSYETCGKFYNAVIEQITEFVIGDPNLTNDSDLYRIVLFLHDLIDFFITYIPSDINVGLLTFISAFGSSTIAIIESFVASLLSTPLGIIILAIAVFVIQSLIFIFAVLMIAGHFNLGIKVGLKMKWIVPIGFEFKLYRGQI